ncbi:MAG: homocitrate synthase [Vicinamibacterales bacterium]
MSRSATSIANPREPIVVSGRAEPLADVPFHRDGPLTRWLMSSAALHPNLNTHIAIHQFTEVEPGTRDYCDVHVHDYDEINVFHTTSALRVAVCLGDETIQVDAPATVYIPAGTPHSANVTSGSGFMVAILMDGAFRAVARNG